MEEERVKAEMRLYALEWMVAQLAVVIYSLTGEPAKILENIRQQAKAGAQRKTFSGVSASESDLLSAELETAVDQLLQMQASLLATKKTP